MANFLSKILSIGSDRDRKELERIAERVNELEPRFQAMTDDELGAMTSVFRERYAAGETLDDLLPEAFATVREASVRTTGLRHFDVQLMGGAALHRGTIAEMLTGEGKTLVSTLAGYLNAIPGKGVHIVTVNDYLARRDSEWMGQVYRFLNMSVGLIQNGMGVAAKKPAYEADVTYGTNSEFGFDYLRDNMVMRADMRVQRGFFYAIVDEADSILIDEARTPLIISGAGYRSASTYKDFARAVRGLTEGVDFEMDEAKHTIATTDEGLAKIERALGIDDIYADASGQLVNHLQQALKAEYMFHRDRQYVVVGGEVKIVDEFTGRIMEGRRYSEGLHQAIEAKEGVAIREENQTLATITLQNYFLMYEKLSGMTGTAMTEDAEFREVYHVPVVSIRPNRAVIREDHDDLVYRTVDAKFNAVIEDVVERHAKGQPCLVGTASIENSERLSRLLDKRGVKHNVLNAKFHEREAQIVAQAGREGAVTIATNMAGRGTDILLGGNADELAEEAVLERDLGIERDVVRQVFSAGDLATLDMEDLAKLKVEISEEDFRTLKDAYEEELEHAREQCGVEREHVVRAGGLCVIGTERHESRRIDNQLRGRAGRQGDPGETQFYLSLEDDLMRLFGGERMDRLSAMMQRYEMPDDVPIQAKLVSKVVESAQRKVEEVNFAMRKNVLDYDNVMDTQRDVIYEERNKILDGKDLMGRLSEIAYDTAQRKVSEFCPEAKSPDTWDARGLGRWLEELTGRDDAPDVSGCKDEGDVVDLVNDYISRCISEKSERVGDKAMHVLASQVMLRVIDVRWRTYLQEMDYLKTGIGLRGYGQRDPLVEYKSEAYAAFGELVNSMYEDFLRMILHMEVRVRQQEQPEPDALRGASYSGPSDAGESQVASRAAAAASVTSAGSPAPAPTGKPRTYRKSDDPDPYVGVGRNDPCPCGSGKKFKHCHGRNR